MDTVFEFTGGDRARGWMLSLLLLLAVMEERANVPGSLRFNMCHMP